MKQGMPRRLLQSTGQPRWQSNDNNNYRWAKKTTLGALTQSILLTTSWHLGWKIVWPWLWVERSDTDPSFVECQAHFWLIINVTWSSSFFFLLQALIVGFRLIEMQLVPKKFVGEADFATLRFNFVILGSFHLYVNNCDGALCQIYLSQLTYFILNLQHYYSWLKK